MDSVLGVVRHAGNDSLLRAIEMSLLSTLSGQPLHVHAEGLRGTGKTTAMRAVRRALPRIRRIKDCLYNCDPAAPHCPQHRDLTAEQVRAIGEEWVPMPFLEISHSAKVGSVVGSINLQQLVGQKPEAALLPGTLPQAHRGILFVDEINRLADTAPELADVLLDVMGTKPGRIQIEETGLPAVELPVQVSVWAASNPDEDPGPLEEIRRQLSDRFDFTVYTDRPTSVAVVEQILSAAEGTGLARTPSALDAAKVEHFRTELAGRVVKLHQVQVPQPIRQQIAELYGRYSLESLRAVQAVHAGIRLTACMEGRSETGAEDLARVVPLALRHRIDAETMKKVTAFLAGLNARTETPAVQPAAPPARPRFPSISFGASAVAPLSEGPTVPAPAPAPGQATGGEPAAGAQEQQAYAAEAAPELAPRPDSQQDDSWLARAMTGLRRSLGLPGAEGGGQGRRDGGAGALGDRYGRTGLRPGENNAPNQGAGMSPAPGRTFAGSEQTGGGNPTGSRAGASRGSQTPPIDSDPLKAPVVAPPMKARPLAVLRADEFIQTEEELSR